jgi:hypothetical protein
MAETAPGKITEGRELVRHAPFIKKTCACGRTIDWEPIEGGYYTSHERAVEVANDYFRSRRWIVGGMAAICPECKSLTPSEKP